MIPHPLQFLLVGDERERLLRLGILRGLCLSHLGPNHHYSPLSLKPPPTPRQTCSSSTCSTLCLRWPVGRSWPASAS